MPNQLRPIALTVDEPAPGLFHWILMERQPDGDQAAFEHRLASADEPYDSFEKAARAGLLKWTILAGDEPRRGPRTIESVPLDPAALAGAATETSA
ncbi:MAG: hypothetical protein V4731_03410 [Pseudomonadota bacterium]